MCLMCCYCMNLANDSEENGGPLSVESLLGVPYCEISDLSLSVTGSVALMILCRGRGTYKMCL